MARLEVSYFCSRLQTMTMPLASLEASRLSSQLKLTSSTGALWPRSLLTAALAARSTSKKCTHMSLLPVTAQMRDHQEVLQEAAGCPACEVSEVLRDLCPRCKVPGLGALGWTIPRCKVT